MDDRRSGSVRQWTLKPTLPKPAVIPRRCPGGSPGPRVVPKKSGPLPALAPRKGSQKKQTNSPREQARFESASVSFPRIFKDFLENLMIFEEI